MQASDDRGNMASISYRTAKGELDYLEGKLALAAVKPFIFNYAIRQSFDRGAPLESYYAAEYRHQCWSVTLSYRDRPGNREVLVNFNRAGLGSLGPVKAY
jgi:LPS-assembly protein